MAPRGLVGRQDPLVHPALDGRDPDPQGLGDPGCAHIRVSGVWSLLVHLSVSTETRAPSACTRPASVIDRHRNCLEPFYRFGRYRLRKNPNKSENALY